MGPFYSRRRGEKPAQYALPSTIEDVDDSDDFRLGLPELSEEEQQQADAAAAEREREANDFSDITGEGNAEDGESPRQEVAPSTPDVSDILAPAEDIDLGDLDLSEFETPEPKPEPAKPKPVPIEDMDLDALLALSAKPEPEPEPEPAPPPPPPKPAAPVQKPKAPPKPAAPVQKPKAPPVPDTPAFSEAKPLDDALETPEDTLNDLAPADDLAPLEEASPADDLGGFPADDLGGFPADDLGGFPADDLAPIDEAAPAEDVTASPSGDQLGTESFGDDFGDFDFGGNALNMNEGLPSEIDEGASKESSVPLSSPEAGDSSSTQTSEPLDFGFGSVEEYKAPEDTGDFTNPDNFTMPDAVDDATASSTPEGSRPKISSDDDFVLPDFDESEGSSDTNFGDAFSNPDNFTMPEAIDDATAMGMGGESASSSGDDFALPDFDEGSGSSDTNFGDSSDASSSAGEADPFSMDGFDMGSDSGSSDTSSDFALPDMDSGASDAFGNDAFGGDFGLDAGSSVPDATESVEDSAPIETFDTSGMEGVDFTPDESSTDFELGNVGGDDDAFSIPGFSDTVGTADLNKAKPDVAVADFSGAMEGPDKPKNTFTDAEYKIRLMCALPLKT